MEIPSPWVLGMQGKSYYGVVEGTHSGWTMAYYLRRRSIGAQVTIEIDEARYTRLANARKTLVDAGAFEQRYELLLGNLMAFETFCAETSLHHRLSFDFRYETAATVISEANRHVTNFLTTARQYADHVVRDFDHLPLTEPFSKTVKRHLSEAYDSAFEYRFVWELRNYSQHHASAVHGIKGRSQESPWTEASMVYCLKKQILEDRGKFKQQVLDELDEIIDIRTMFRGYMAAVSCVQVALRKLINGACEQARMDTKQAMDEFAAAQSDEEKRGNPAIGLAAVMSEDGGTFNNEVPLLLNWDDTRVALAKKNSMRIRLEPPTPRR